MPATSAPSGVDRIASGSRAWSRPIPSADAASAWARHPVRRIDRRSSWASAATSRSTASRRSRPARARPATRWAWRRSSGPSRRDRWSDQIEWTVNQPASSLDVSGSRPISPARSTPPPTMASTRAWSAPPSVATVATTRRSPSLSAPSTSSARKSSMPGPHPAVRSSARAGHPPRSPSRSSGTSRRAANADSSSSAKARSASPIRSTRPWAASRASGTGGSWRPLSTTCPFAGSDSTSPATSVAAPESRPISCTSSSTRQTCRGERCHSSAASVRPTSTGSTSPGSRSSGRSAARLVASPSASPRGSSSPGPQPSQKSSPRGASAFSSIAWARRVDLPNPGPATITVTGCSHRSWRRRRSWLRRRTGRPGRGGANR